MRPLIRTQHNRLCFSADIPSAEIRSVIGAGEATALRALYRYLDPASHRFL